MKSSRFLFVPAFFIAANGAYAHEASGFICGDEFHRVAALRTREVRFTVHHWISAICGVNVPPSRSTSYFDIA